jgi:hypothetical protein
MDRLVSDIQEYLREEEQHRSESAADSLQDTQRSPRRSRLNALVGAATLLAACAVGSITVAIMLLGILGGPAQGPIHPIWLFAAGGCGIFFSTMLVSSWKRLLLLARIERNTRLILESKQVANELLEDYINRMM